MPARFFLICLSLLCGSLLLQSTFAEESKPECRQERGKQKKSDTVVRYVGVSSATIRNGRSTDSSVLGNLPIGTPVRVSCEIDGWIRVWAPSYKGTVGWVRSDLTVSTQPTISGLLESYKLTPITNTTVRRQLAERAIALDPLDLEGHQNLVETLKQTGEKQALNRATSRLEGLKHPKVFRSLEEPKLIFVVDHGSMSPIARLKDGVLSTYPSPSSSDREEDTYKIIEDFSQQYFRAGRAYNFYTHGGKAGLALVRGKEEPTCASVTASIKLLSSSKNAVENGILTNFDLSERQANLSSVVSVAQETAVLKLVRQLLLQRNVPISDIDELLQKPSPEDRFQERRVITTAYTSNGSHPILVATFNLEFRDNYRGYNVRIIAEPNSSGEHAITYEDFNQADSDQMYSPRTYLSHMDINQDGNDELIFSARGYEWWWYEALGREKTGWKVLVSGGGGGC